MRIALFTRQRENLPLTYWWEGQTVQTGAGIALCQPFTQKRQTEVQVIVIAFKDVGKEDDAYSTAWEANIVAVRRSAPPYDTVGKSRRYDIFYANARRLEVVPERSPGPGYVRYIE